MGDLFLTTVHYRGNVVTKSSGGKFYKGGVTGEIENDEADVGSDGDDMDDEDEEEDLVLDHFTDDEYNDLASDRLHQVYVNQETNNPNAEQQTPTPTTQLTIQHETPTTQPNIQPQNESDEDLTFFGTPLVDISSETDYEDHDKLFTPPNSDEEENPRYPTFTADTDMDDPNFVLGQTFRDSKEFKEAIMNYRVKWGYGLKLIKNESKRVRVKCAEGCQWSIYASLMSDGQTLQVKTFVNTHSCIRAFHSRQVTAKWVGKKYKEKFRKDPNMKVVDIVDGVRGDFQVEISNSKAFRGRKEALLEINGSAAQHYSMVRGYCLELIRSNPGSTAIVAIQGPQSYFHRMYICLDACKRGFMEGCRPLISLDGCHLTGQNQGVLLTAVGIDANDGLYPIAYAVVAIENKDNWSWFLQNLLNDIGTVEDHRWVFITDQQKGLLPALEDIVPAALHRFCGRHLYANFKKKHTGKKLQDLMWKASHETTEKGFEAQLEKVRKVSKAAFAHLKGIKPKFWVKYAFDTWPKCDILLNNLCETFNSKIKDARDKPLLTMLELIRRYLMTRIQRNRDAMSRYQGPICPRIQERLQKSKDESFGCKSHWSGGSKYEVNVQGEQWVVDLEQHTCSCYLWDVSGIPCKHAVSAIAYRKERPEDYVHRYLKKETYMHTYSFLIQPCNGPQLWETGIGGPVVPPRRHAQIGRPPKQKRRKDPDEPQNPYKLKRKQNSLKCSNCKLLGHNTRSCKRQRTNPNPVVQGQTFTSTSNTRNKGKAPVRPNTRGRKRATLFMGFKVPRQNEGQSTNTQVLSASASQNTNQSQESSASHGPSASARPNTSQSQGTSASHGLSASARPNISQSQGTSASHGPSASARPNISQSQGTSASHGPSASLMQGSVTVVKWFK